jgi:hypothetical protein
VTTADGTARWLFVFARHAESTANADLVLSTDPSRPTPLTERGRAQARALGAQLANVPIDLAVSSRLPRARETVSIALADRPVPVTIEPSFDEIQVGDLDGKPIQAYWDWLGQHTASDRLPHGESIDDALRRYAGAAQAPGEGRTGHARRHSRARAAAYRGGGRARLPALARHGLCQRGSVPLRRARRPACAAGLASLEDPRRTATARRV